MATKNIHVRTMLELNAEGKKAEYLFWVGSAGSYDDRAKKITRAFVKILESCNIDYAVLGQEETDSGDSAKRAGNEFLFQMQAMQNIEIMNSYEVKKIITCDPHDFNTIKNEYPELGGNYEILHHTQFINNLILQGKLKINDKVFSGNNITYHDPCYLGRGNGEYNAPRNVLKTLNCNIVEMERNKSRALCCGAGGAQMFKEAEKGNMEVFELRTIDALAVNPNIIATSCPFCMTMLTDGVKLKNKENEIRVLDIAEIIAESLGI
jgi:Fe-S oxidoreductase